MLMNTDLQCIREELPTIWADAMYFYWHEDLDHENEEMGDSILARALFSRAPTIDEATQNHVFRRLTMQVNNIQKERLEKMILLVGAAGESPYARAALIAHLINRGVLPKGLQEFLNADV